MRSVKKFSTAALLTLAALLASTHAFATGSPACQWAAEAPDRHRVQQGDTLWELASLFLQNPWCWPHVWQQNQDRISNPHWIYPGQVIVLDRARGVLRPDDDAGNALPLAHWSPRVRAETIASLPIPLVSRQLQTLLSRAPLLPASSLVSAPVISDLPEQRRMAAEGDIVFVKGALGTATQFNVVRVAQALRDPDSGELLGMAGQHVGRVTLTAKGELSHRFVVTASRSELQPGDKLMPVTDARLPSLSPHPSTTRSGKLIAILHEGRWATLHDLVALNLGARDGLDPGSVVRVVRHGRIGHHESASSFLSGDDQTQAILLVFDVAERVSLAAVMRSTAAITVGDDILSAEPLPK